MSARRPGAGRGLRHRLSDPVHGEGRRPRWNGAGHRPVGRGQRIRPRQDEARCSYETGVAWALTAPEASFDVVVTSLAVPHLPEDLRSVALRDMYRVLRSGGRLLVADFRPPRARLVRHLIAASAGHVRAEYRVDLPDGLVADAGFEVRGRGDVRPWLRYVQGVRPEKSSRPALL
ncbi:methyltransferase domain-containing protein [Streptomyces sp. NPDC002088]|uniref:class I SAM-dependent methyltransferase n=1 Tax=Streptomyces sp. NPDC002088 TaxID=3154665 RepID=UPI00333317BB